MAVERDANEQRAIILFNIKNKMLNIFIFFVLLGIVFYLFVQSKYYKLKLKINKSKLRKAKEKKKTDSEKCPSYFSQHDNMCRYNKHLTKFTCQFNPKHLVNSGFYYNSPDICCHNRCDELNKILDAVLEREKEDKRKKDDSSGVWCQTDNGVNCKFFKSSNGKCPNDKLNSQEVPAFKNKDDCEIFGKQVVCKDLTQTKCYESSNCVWTISPGDDKGKCLPGTGDGPYNATLNANVGYINGKPTAVAGNTNPFFMVSTLQSDNKDNNRN